MVVRMTPATVRFTALQSRLPLPGYVHAHDRGDHRRPPSFRASARAILQAEGFEVVGEAEDGESGIAAARALAPDVLLLDVQLPDMDGFAVCRELGLNGGPPAVVLVPPGRERLRRADRTERCPRLHPQSRARRDCTGRFARMRPRTLALVALGGLALGRTRHGARPRERPHREHGRVPLARPHGRALVPHLRRDRALASPGQPHRLPPRPRRVSLVPRRARRVGQRLGLHRSACSSAASRSARSSTCCSRTRRGASRDAATSGWSSARTRSSSSARSRNCWSTSTPTRAAPAARARSPSPAATRRTRSSGALSACLPLHS